MTHPDQEEILRRALHAVADAIEPAADGLERIRERLSKPRPLAVAWLMAGWTGMAQPALLRMEPVAAEVAGRLWERLSTWQRLVIRSLGTAVARLRPVAVSLLAAIRLLRPGPGMSRHEKLRSAIAFGAAAVIGAAGGFALSAGLPQQMISAANSFISPSQTHHAPGGGHNPGVNGGGQQFPPSGPTPQGKRTPAPTASPSCTSKAKASPSPSASPTASPSASPTASPTVSPTVSPTGSPTASPTVSPSHTLGGILSSPAANRVPEANVASRVVRPKTTAKPTSKATASASPSPSC
jgi:hypothetical protein